MQVRIVMEITNEGGKTIVSEVVADLTKATKGPEDFGLSLAEGKASLAKLQHKMVETSSAISAEAAAVSHEP